MRFTPALLDTLITDTDERRSLQQMNTGGDSGGSGYEYESMYAQYRLAEQLDWLLTGRPGPGDVSIQGCSYVDDVVRSFAGVFHYSQLKTSDAETTWTAGNSKLTREFQKQHSLCIQAGMDAQDFKLELVTPHLRRRDLLRDKIPEALTPFTDIIFFPRTLDLAQVMIDTTHPIRPHLRALCAYTPDSIDLQRVILYNLVTAWGAVGGGRSAPRVAADVLAFLYEDKKLPIKNLGVTLDALTKAVIESVSIEGLTLSEENGFIRYRYGRLEGTVARIDTPSFQRFVNRLHQAPPATFDDFTGMLP